MRRSTSLAMGLDIGSANARAAVFQSGEAVLVAGDDGQRSVAAVVSIDGRRALAGASALRRAATHPAETARRVKRLLATERVSLGAARFTPERLLAVLIRDLRDRAEQQLGQRPRAVVLCAPAWFEQGQRQALVAAAERLGLQVLGVILEPIAAALSIAALYPEPRRVVLVDVGASSISASVLSVSAARVELCVSVSDDGCGGDDVDEALQGMLDQQLERLGAPGQRDPASAEWLRQSCERAKRRLTKVESASVDVSALAAQRSTALHLDRSQLARALDELLRRLELCATQALRTAGLGSTELEGLLLCGGMAQVPAVRERLERVLGRRCDEGLDAECAVALGAAVQASVLDGARHIEMVESGAILESVRPSAPAPSAPAATTGAAQHRPSPAPPAARVPAEISSRSAARARIAAVEAYLFEAGRTTEPADEAGRTEPADDAGRAPPAPDATVARAGAVAIDPALAPEPRSLRPRAPRAGAAGSTGHSVGPRDPSGRAGRIPQAIGSGRLRNPSDVADIVELPLGRAIESAELEPVALAVLLARLMPRRGVTGTLRLEGDNGSAVLGVIDGVGRLNDGDRRALRKAFLWPEGRYVLEPGAPEITRRDRVSLVHLAVEGLRAVCRELTVEQIAAGFDEQLSLAPVLRPERVELVSRLGLESRDQRLIRGHWDGVRTMREIVEQGGLGRHTALQIFVVLTAFGCAEYRIAQGRPGESLAERLDDRASKMARADHFAALGVHWSSSAAQIHQAYRSLQERLAERGTWAEAAPEACRRMRERTAAAYAVLGDEVERRAYRQEQHPDIDTDALDDLLRRRGQALELRGDEQAAKEVASKRHSVAAWRTIQARQRRAPGADPAAPQRRRPPDRSKASGPGGSDPSTDES